jgi:hypothetical protein
MKIYKLWQDVNHDYDTYDSIIVCAKNEEEAKRIQPSEYYEYGDDGKSYFKYSDGSKNLQTDDSWCELEDVKVEYLGEAKKELKKGVILTSFNAG